MVRLSNSTTKNDAPRNVGEVQRRLFLALVEQRLKVVFANQLRELIVRAEVRRREGGERGGIEVGTFTDRGHELAGAVDEQRGTRCSR